MIVVDSTAFVELSQIFVNNQNLVLSTKYVLPVDESAAVCEFQAEIGERFVIGEVKEKSEAENEYREAVTQGHAAFLLSEAKDGDFFAAVFFPIATFRYL